MSTTTQTTTLRSILFGDEDARATIKDALEASAVTKTIAAALHGVSRTLRSAAGDEVQDTVADVLSFDLIDVLIGGWRKHRTLTEAAERTIGSPGAREIVELAAHRITFTSTPRIDVLVDQLKVAEIEVEIGVTVDLDAVCGVVTGGRLVALRSGRAEVKVEVACLSHPVISATRSIDLPVAIGLGPGILLVESIKLPEPLEPVSTQPLLP